MTNSNWPTTFRTGINEGKFSLAGFDALVTFHSLEIKALPENQKMSEAKNQVSKSARPEIARLEFEAASAELDSIKATIAADQYRYTYYPSIKTDEALEKSAALEQANAKLARAKFLLAGSDTKKTQAGKIRSEGGRKTNRSDSKRRYLHQIPATQRYSKSPRNSRAQIRRLHIGIFPAIDR